MGHSVPAGMKCLWGIILLYLFASPTGDGHRHRASGLARDWEPGRARYFHVGGPKLHSLVLSLRGGGPKAQANAKTVAEERSFPPGSLPEWAEDIVKYRNSTLASEREIRMRQRVEEASTTSADEEDSSLVPKWGGKERGWHFERDANMGNDEEQEMSSGGCSFCRPPARPPPPPPRPPRPSSPPSSRSRRLLQPLAGEHSPVARLLTVCCAWFHTSGMRFDCLGRV